MDLMQIRRRILTEAGRLPPTYREYEYLRTSGYNSRIDTGVPGNDDTLVMDFVYMPAHKVNYFGTLGNYIDENTRCFRLIQSTSAYPTYYLFSAGKRKAGSSSSIVGAASTILNNKTHFRLSWGKCEAEWDGGSQTVTEAADSTTAVSTDNICIGATRIGQTGASSQTRFYGHFKIWSGGSLIREYVPVVRLRDSKAGYYDLINHTFNPSIGSAEFVAGND